MSADLINELESLATGNSGGATYEYSQQQGTTLPLPSDLLRSIRRVEKKLRRTEQYELPVAGMDGSNSGARRPSASPPGGAADEDKPKHSLEWCRSRIRRRCRG